MQTLVALFNRAQGLRTYLAVAAAALFFVGGLLGLIPDAASVKLGGMFVAASVACFRLSLANSDKTFDQKLSTLESVFTVKPDPNPPTDAELEAIVKNAVVPVWPWQTLQLFEPGSPPQPLNPIATADQQSKAA